MNPPNIIAEIGCNHQGSIERAEEMISVAAFCGVQGVKLQKRDVNVIDPSLPHHNPEHAFGETYLEHRRKLEFDVEQHTRLRELAHHFNLLYGISVFDVQSIRDCREIHPDYLKIGSGLNRDHPLIEYAVHNWDGDIHLSLGMTTDDEQDRAVMILNLCGSLGRTVLYACVSAYPCPLPDAAILEVNSLKLRYGDRVKGIGYSDHTTSVVLSPAVTVLGATWIERHFTLDRASKGTDQAVSLEPEGMRKVVKYVRGIAAAMNRRGNKILECEQETRQRFPSKEDAS